jgi:hypothetical protein
VPPLPITSKEAVAWSENLLWRLSGQHWCHDGVHACEILTTTPETTSLSQDLLSLLQRSTLAHKNANHQRAVQSLLEEEMAGVDGLNLIKNGKGFELFQLRVKTGFSRGLGYEVMSYLWNYIHAVQATNESVGSFSRRLSQLYRQVQLTENCELGGLTQKLVFVFGLEKGAYHEVLAPFAKKLQLGQGKLKLQTSSLADIQKQATNVLVSSKYYLDNLLQPGKPVVTARIADTDVVRRSDAEASSDPSIEKIVAQLRSKQPLNRGMTTWIRRTFSCIHCFSNGHDTADCFGLEEKWNITAKVSSSTSKTSSSSVPPSSARGEKGRKATNTSAAKSDPTPTATTKGQSTDNTGENDRPRVSFDKSPDIEIASKASSQSNSESEADEDDDTFAMDESVTTDTDPDLLAAITQTAAQAHENQRRNQLIDDHVATPKPLSEKPPPPTQPSTSCRMAKADRK